MPTTRQRHTVTETDAVERALAPLRQRGVRIDFADLVVRGAADRLAELEAERADVERRAELRERFLERGTRGIDLDAAIAVRERGWTG